MPQSRSPRAGSPGSSGSLLTRLFIGLNLRTGVMIGLIVTYLWRYQDLSPVLQPLRLALLVSAVAIVVLAFEPNVKALGRAFARPYVAIFLIWTVWLGFGTIFALDTELAWIHWSDVHLKNVLMFVFVLSTLVTLASIRLAVAGHLLGVSAVVFFYVKSGFPTEWTPLSGADRNDLALMFNLATPLAVFYALTERHRRMRIAAWALAGTVALSTVMTQSRGGFLTVAVVVLFLSFRVRGIRFHRRFIPLAAFVLGIAVMPPEVRARLGTLLETEDDYNRTDAKGRVAIWKRGMQYMLDHRVTGVGMDNFHVAETTLAEEVRTEWRWKGHVAHNVFVQAGAESGIVGGLLFILMIVAAIVSLNRTRARMVRRKVPETWILFADLLTACLIAFCVGGFFLSWTYSPFLMFLFALVAGYQGCESQIVALGRKRRAGPPRRRVRRRKPVAGRPPLVLGTHRSSVG